jgi:hypothetical protein
LPLIQRETIEVVLSFRNVSPSFFQSRNKYADTSKIGISLLFPLLVFSVCFLR